MKKTKKKSDIKSGRREKSNKNAFSKIWNKCIVSISSSEVGHLYTCRLCKFSTTSRALSQVHTRRLHTPQSLWPPPCSQCGLKLPLSSEMRRHQWFSHSDHVFENLSVKCTQCDRRFVSERAMKRHHVTHRIPHQNDFACEICDVSFTTKYNLKMHIAVNHIRPMPRFECSHCHRIFKTTQNLRSHLNIHSKSKPFVCHQNGCHKTYYSHTSYKNHVKSHSLSFPCNQCEKSFYSIQNLRRHEIIHKDLSKFGYRCSVCSKQFSQNSSRVRHEKIHTKEKNYHCQECHFRTGDSSVLRRHLKKHQKPSHLPPDVVEIKPPLLFNRNTPMSSDVSSQYQPPIISDNSGELQKRNVPSTPDDVRIIDNCATEPVCHQLRHVHYLPDLNLVMEGCDELCPHEKQPIKIRFVDIQEGNSSPLIPSNPQELHPPNSSPCIPRSVASQVIPVQPDLISQSWRADLDHLPSSSHPLQISEIISSFISCSFVTVNSPFFSFPDHTTSVSPVCEPGVYCGTRSPNIIPYANLTSTQIDSTSIQSNQLVLINNSHLVDIDSLINIY